MSSIDSAAVLPPSPTDTEMSSLSLPENFNDFTFVKNAYFKQLGNCAYDKLVPIGDLTPLTAQDIEAAKKVIEDLEKNTEAPRFGISLAADKIFTVKLAEDLPKGSMNFFTNAATLIMQSPIPNGIPKVGLYQAIIQLIPREEEMAWIGPRLLKIDEVSPDNDEFEQSLIDVREEVVAEKTAVDEDTEMVSEAKPLDSSSNDGLTGVIEQIVADPNGIRSDQPNSKGKGKISESPGFRSPEISSAPKLSVITDLDHQTSIRPEKRKLEEESEYDADEEDLSEYDFSDHLVLLPPVVDSSGSVKWRYGEPGHPKKRQVYSDDDLELVKELLGIKEPKTCVPIDPCPTCVIEGTTDHVYCSCRSEGTTPPVPAPPRPTPTPVPPRPDTPFPHVPVPPPRLTFQTPFSSRPFAPVPPGVRRPTTPLRRPATPYPQRLQPSQDDEPVSSSRFPTSFVRSPAPSPADRLATRPSPQIPAGFVFLAEPSNGAEMPTVSAILSSDNDDSSSDNDVRPYGAPITPPPEIEEELGKVVDALLDDMERLHIDGASELRQDLGRPRPPVTFRNLFSGRLGNPRFRSNLPPPPSPMQTIKIVAFSSRGPTRGPLRILATSFSELQSPKSEKSSDSSSTDVPSLVSLSGLDDLGLEAKLVESPEDLLPPSVVRALCRSTGLGFDIRDRDLEVWMRVVNVFLLRVAEDVCNRYGRVQWLERNAWFKSSEHCPSIIQYADPETCELNSKVTTNVYLHPLEREGARQCLSFLDTFRGFVRDSDLEMAFIVILHLLDYSIRGRSDAIAINNRRIKGEFGKPGEYPPEAQEYIDSGRRPAPSNVPLGSY